MSENEFNNKHKLLEGVLQIISDDKWRTLVNVLMVIVIRAVGTD